LKLRQIALRVITELEAFEGRGHSGLQIAQGRFHRQESRMLTCGFAGAVGDDWLIKVA